VEDQPSSSSNMHAEKARVHPQTCVKIRIDLEYRDTFTTRATRTSRITRMTPNLPAPPCIHTPHGWSQVMPAPLPIHTAYGRRHCQLNVERSHSNHVNPVEHLCKCSANQETRSEHTTRCFGTMKGTATNLSRNCIGSGTSQTESPAPT